MKEIFEPPQRVPIRSWAGRLDREVLTHLGRTARSRVLVGPVIVLPDVHQAGDVCVGTVLVTETVVFPAAVGEDLGCGMRAQLYAVEADEFTKEEWARIIAALQSAIPTGRRSQARPVPFSLELARHAMSCRAAAHTRDWLGPRHLGSLGGGNHFVEFQCAEDGRLWVTVHAGSRGPGAWIAQLHAHAAQTGGGQKDPSGLWCLEWDSPAGQAFRQDLNWALLFAEANRKAMMQCATEVLEKFLGRPLEASPAIDVPHNLICRETHGGRDLIVHRKGASPAPSGMRGLLPGSMGTATYVVEGLGAASSYRSASHGAGRRLSRMEARRRISVTQLRRELRHVVCPADADLEAALVEESPSAYNDIREVLAQQSDLVRPILRLEPRAVLKGG